jgi:hypothetical protein
VLDPICRGLVGYVSYIAACRSSPVYSEYLLYEPILRIAAAQGYRVRCEVAVGKSNSGLGDRKRIDFALDRPSSSLAIEVKWIKHSRPNVKADVDKLLACKQAGGAAGYVLCFGHSRYFGKLIPNAGDYRPLSKGRLVSWSAGRTSYAAQWFKYA